MVNTWVILPVLIPSFLLLSSNFRTLVPLKATNSTLYVTSPPPPTHSYTRRSQPPYQTPSLGAATTINPRSRTGRATCSTPEEGNSSQNLAAAVEYSVMDYGAVGDGTTNDTLAFTSAWTDACAVAGGYIHAPSGYTFLVYPVTFTGPCLTDFILRVDGTIQAPESPSVWEDQGLKYWFKFKKVSMTIQGTGTFNGRGQTWWADSCKTNSSNTCVDGPTAVVFDTCTNVTVKHVTILNSQQMHLAFEHSQTIIVNNVTVTAPGSSPNTDGIHLQNSSSVTIRNTSIGTGDDCISIQTGSSNIVVKNVTCGPGHGISVGGLGKSNSTAQVENLEINTVTFTNATNGVRIKSWQGSSGYAKGFSFKNIKMVNTSNPILIDQYYCDSGSSGSCPNYTSNVVISNISYSNITGTSASKVAVKFSCSETVACTEISLKNIDLVRTSGSNATSSCVNAFGNSTGVVIPPSCLQSD